MKLEKKDFGIGKQNRRIAFMTELRKQTNVEIKFR